MKRSSLSLAGALVLTCSGGPAFTGCSPQLDATGATFDRDGVPGGGAGGASDGASGAPTSGLDGAVRCAPARMSDTSVRQSLHAPAPRAQAWFGYTAALLDGALAVAAPFATTTSMPGELYVSQSLDGEFAPVERLDELFVTAADGTLSASRLPYFGGQGSDVGAFSVALGPELLIVGVAGADRVLADGGLAEDSGVVEVFRRTAEGWSPPQPLVLEDAQPCALFGRRVALEGDVLAVSAPGSTLDGTSSCGQMRLAQGAVHVYRDDGQEFRLERSFWAEGTGGSLFGEGLDLQEGVLAIGAPFEASRSPAGDSRATGAVYLHQYNGSWEPAGRVDNVRARANSAFGASVAVAAGMLAVGAPLDDHCDGLGPSGDGGRVYVFSKSGAEWQRSECLYGSDPGSSDLFGWSVAFGEDDLIVGAPFESSGDGAAYVFRKHDDRYTCLLSLEAPNRQGLEPLVADEVFGTWVGASRTFVAVGAPRATVPLNGASALEAGTVHIFDLPSP